jgi:tetratricopeptide (TPR) repeat protein
MISPRHYRNALSALALTALAGCASTPSEEPAPAPEPAAARAPSARASAPATTAPAIGTAASPITAAPAGTPAAAANAAAIAAAPVISARAISQFNQALALLAAGKNQDAELELKTLALGFPDYPAPHVNLGLLYLRNGQLPDAEKEFKAAVERGPEPRALDGLGLVYRRTGRFPDAEKSYQAAIAADPTYAAAYRNLGVFYDLYLQSPERALPVYQKYQELSGGADKQVAEWIKDVTRRAGAAQKPAEAKTP